MVRVDSCGKILELVSDTLSDHHDSIIVTNSDLRGMHVDAITETTRLPHFTDFIKSTLCHGTYHNLTYKIDLMGQTAHRRGRIIKLTPTEVIIVNALPRKI